MKINTSTNKTHFQRLSTLFFLVLYFNVFASDNIQSDTLATQQGFDPCDATLSGNTDTDGDNVSDICDIDDDNDGILDTAELVCGNPAELAWDTTLIDANPANIATSLAGKSVTVTSQVTVATTGSTSFLGTSFNYAGSVSADAGTPLNGNVQLQLQQSSNLGAQTRVTFEITPHDFGVLNLFLSDFEFTDFIVYAEDASGTRLPTTSWNVKSYENDAAGTSPASRPNGFTTNATDISFISSNVWDGSTNPQNDDAMRIRFNINTLSAAVRLVVETNRVFDGDNSQDQAEIMLTTTCPLSDYDGDGIPSYLDLDTDNDGIPDNVEAQTTQAYLPPIGDSDGNGIDDAYETTPGSGEGLTPVNTDGDSLPDYLDSDSDNDGITDCLENNDATSSCPVTSADVGSNGLANWAESADDYTDVSGNAYNDTSNVFDLDDTDNDTAANGTDAAPTTTDLDYRDTKNLINAINDDYSPTPIASTTGGNTPSVLLNDTLNGVILNPADVTLTPSTAPTPTSGSISMNPDGTISIAAGTTAGTYTYDYQICENLNPTNCATATATIVVNASTINAINDDYSPTPIASTAGGNTPSVLLNDTLNGVILNPADVTLTPSTAPTPASGSISMNPDGTISIAAGTTAGTYTYDYQICENLNPTNCATATATIVVNASTINAINDDYSPTPIASTTGGNTPSVLLNDTLNGVILNPADVTLTPSTAPTPTSGSISMNPDGTISIAAGTTAGTYTYDYQICENLNPTNCATATATIVVAVDTDNDGIPDPVDPDDDNDGNPDDTDPNPTIPTAVDDGIIIITGSNSGPINIIGNDDYIPSADLSITDTGTGTATGTTVFDPLTGEMTYTTANGETGTITVVYEVCYTAVNPMVCSTAVVTLTISNMTPQVIPLLSLKMLVLLMLALFAVSYMKSPKFR